MTLPNIIYLHSHDTGRWIQPYGYPVPTPNFQRVAEQGVLFRQAFCVAPTCSPSRASLLTGQYAHCNGMLGLAHRGFRLNDVRQHWLHTLRPAGYHSALVGMQHIAADSEEIGYDRILDVTNADAEYVAPATVEFLENNPATPFFLSIGFGETHRPFPEPTPTEDPRYCRPPASLPDTPEIRLDMAGFKASARRLDQGLGLILTALEQLDLAGNTLLICTTDHGPPFPGMKCTLTDAGTGVLLLLRGPGDFTGGRVIDSMVTHLDIFPTLCDLLKLTPPAWLQGRSLLPLLRGEKTELHDEIFAEVTYHAAYEPQRAVRTRRYKYIRRFEERTSRVLPNCDDSPSKDILLAHGWQQHAPPAEQLFDLALDPAERENLVDRPETHSLLADMRRRLADWMQATADPLLDGPVAAPSGARLNDPDGLSPEEPTRVVP